MSKPSKTSSSAVGAESVADLPFEEALRRLETVVQTMETDDLALETLLARYEEGVKLVEVCQSRLTAAEGRLDQLEQTAAGNLTLKPISAQSTTTGTSASTDPGTNPASEPDDDPDTNTD
jgi:exodeoxyribonuclease VII small subunit